MRVMGGKAERLGGRRDRRDEDVLLEGETDRRRALARALSPTSTVTEAKVLLALSQADAALVTDDGRPVGVATEAALRGWPGRSPHESALIADVMDLEVVSIPPGADVRQTLAVYRDAAWQSLRRRRPCASEVMARREAACVPAGEAIGG